MSSDSVTTSDLFQCTNCGECCKGYGGTYVTDRDIKAISDYTNTDQKEFVEKYCRMSGKKPLLVQGENGYCIFWDKTCTIHPVKPKMCKKWPFIESILIDISNWDLMAGSCPGMRNDFQDMEVEKCVTEELEKTGR